MVVVNCSAFALPNAVNYCPTYVSTDVSPAAIDTIVSVIAVFASLAVIIGLALFYRFIKHGKV